MATWTLYEGDCLEVMRELPSESVDAVVTDPPYGLEFMGKEWDKLAVPKPGNLGGFADGNKPSFERVRRHLPAMQEWHYRWAVEALRVLKPGGHLLAFGGTRTYHRLACAIEDAGFEVRDCLMWLYGSGFPKSLDVSKAIDKKLGAKREVVAIKKKTQSYGYEGNNVYGGDKNRGGIQEVTSPATPEAKQWEGWGTSLKPAVEPVILARKPLSEKNVATNVLKWGTGGLNIDGCRVGNEELVYSPKGIRPGQGNYVGDNYKPNNPNTTVQGRFPANVLLDEEAAAMLDEQTGPLHSQDPATRISRSKVKGVTGFGTGVSVEYGDSGGASRFFYVAKASKRERTMNGKVENNHPTVKPIKLMRYLCRLITPPGGLILDPFAGSGTTLIAAVEEGFSVIGIEREPEYCEIIRQRMQEAVQVALPMDA